MSWEVGYRKHPPIPSKPRTGWLMRHAVRKPLCNLVRRLEEIKVQFLGWNVS